MSDRLIISDVSSKEGKSSSRFRPDQRILAIGVSMTHDQDVAIAICILTSG